MERKLTGKEVGLIGCEKKRVSFKTIYFLSNLLKLIINKRKVMRKRILKHIKSRDIFRVLITGIIIVILFFFLKELLGNMSTITKLSQSAGFLGPLVLILLIGLGILLSPIPSVVLIIAAGYLYGIWMGALYSYIAHLLAAIGAFAVFRKINGNENNKTYRKYKKLISKNKKLLYLLYAVPVIPISITTLITATSKIKWKRFLEIIILSFIPAVLFFSFFGERIGNKNLLEIGILIIIVAIVGFIMFKVIEHDKKRMMNGYPSRIKLPNPKINRKYLKLLG